jgi:hypothetical protein
MRPKEYAEFVDQNRELWMEMNVFLGWSQEHQGAQMY